MRTSTTAIVSLVFGALCWMALPVVGAIVAIVCGHVARREIRAAAPRTVEGDGLALAGLILGYVQLALSILILLAIAVVIGHMPWPHDWHWHWR